jgi:DNA polymerase III delta prime subunit
MAREDTNLWVEKYRPRTINECILPEDLKATFQKFVDNGDLPNLLLAGSAGVGKTTVARALCEELKYDYIVVNASEDSGIGVLRDKIRSFASTVSLMENGKAVILDEADYLNPNSTQPALRGFIEEFADNCRFILTCNYKNRLIEPIHSRCSNIDFVVAPQEKPKMLAKFMGRIKAILEAEQVTYNKEAVAQLLVKHYPDYRRVLNELQRYAASGTIDAGILVNMTAENLNQLVGFLKDSDFTKMRKWVANNSDNDFNQMIREIWNYSSGAMDVKSQAELVLILGEYQYRMAFVADQEINLAAMLTEIMGRCQFKE